MSNKSTHFFLKASPLFLAIFIDSMGLGLLFPILNALFVSAHTGFLTGHVTQHTRHFLFGLTVSIFMLCWFFGAAYLGDLSDAIGRKKSLTLALFGSSFGYLLSAIAVGIHSIELLIIGRMIAGFTGGSQAIAQAAVVDISTPELKARNIGLILLSVSLGFMFGPMCGGFFSSTAIYSGFTLSTPLYFASAVSLVNAFLLILLFKETFTPKIKMHFQLHRAIEIFISAFKHPKVRYLSFVLFLMLLGWSSYYSFISMYLTRHFHLSINHVDLYITAMALGFGLSFGWIVNFLAHHFSLKRCTSITLLLGGSFVLLSAIAPSMIYLWLLVIPIGIVIGIPYSMLLTIFSNQVDADSQGWVMGITGSIMAAAFAITGITSSLLANWGISLPILFAGLFLMLSALAMLMWKGRA